MLRWISKILYFVMIVFITFLVSNFSEASKVIDFFNSQKAAVLSDNRHLIAATTVTNYHDGTNAYIKNVPLYQEKFIAYDDTGAISFQIDIAIYAYVEAKNTQANNAFAIIYNDLIIKDSTVLIENNQPVIQLEINLDKEITVQGNNFKQTKEYFVPLFESSTGFIAINHNILKVSDGYAEIEKLSFSYLTDQDSELPLVTLSNPSLDMENQTDKFDDEGFNRDISNVSSTNIDLINQYGLSTIKTSDAFYFDAALDHKLNSYNYYYVQYIAIELLFVIPLTYFLFFHRHVLELLKKRKARKHEEMKAYQDSIVLNHEKDDAETEKK